MLEGQIVWITGAGSGIGRACALAFAGAGARLALTGRRAEPLEETAAMLGGRPGDTLIAAADLTDPARIAEVHRKIVDRLGDPDILINNAGSNIGPRHWRDLHPDDAAKVIAVNLTAPFQCSLAVLPAMRMRRRGVLIHVSSLSGVMIHLVSGRAIRPPNTL